MECTAHNGTITGCYIFSPVCNMFSPVMAIDDTTVVRKDFLMRRDGMAITSSPAKLYFWRKYLRWLDEKEEQDKRESRVWHKQIEEEERIAFDAIMEYRRAMRV